MSRRHPFTVLMLCWLVFVAIVVLADCLLKPAPVTLTEAPTRVPMVVTPYVFATVTPLVPERPLTARDYLPMRATSTRVPATATFTVVPATATPTTNPTPPVQRGSLDGA